MKMCFKCKALYSPLDARSFHQLPKNQELRKKWIDILQLSNMNKSVYICSDHFSKEIFYPMFEGQVTAKLIRGALPSAIHLAHCQESIVYVRSDDYINIIAGPNKPTLGTKMALDSSRRTQYLDDVKVHEIDDVKVEDVHIVEQFTDEYDVHKREAFIIKGELGDFDIKPQQVNKDLISSYHQECIKDSIISELNVKQEGTSDQENPEYGSFKCDVKTEDLETVEQILDHNELHSGK